MTQNRAEAERRRARETAAIIVAALTRNAATEMFTGAPAILKNALMNIAREMDSRANGRQANIDELFSMGATWNPIAGDDQEVPQ